tara:strand:- start:458 stop:586 length:129 start_codon:yes stop_codon:yes gene_type:complete
MEQIAFSAVLHQLVVAEAVLKNQLKTERLVDLVAVLVVVVLL